jgi:uncharacterized protein involved in exopolysaccharide biosynthesis
VSLLLPPTYTASARLFPPQQSQSIAAGVAGQISAASAVAPLALNLKSPTELYVGVLMSRTIADNVIARFKLKELYGATTSDDARAALARVSRISTEKSGLIQIEVQDEDARRAADIANAYAQELERLLSTLALTEAGQRRVYLEKELVKTKDILARAELTLKKTQESTGVISIDEQGRATLGAAAALHAQVAAKEIELQSMRTFATESNPNYLRAKEELAGLRKQLDRIERGSGKLSGGALVPFDKVPEAGLESVRNLRDVKYATALLEFLARQVETAKLDESKDAPLVQVIDRAVPPERRSTPKRTLIVLISTLSAAVLGVLMALILEKLEHARRDAESSRKLSLLRGSLIRW